MRSFRCTNCAAVVFFDNTRCVNCGFALGFVPEQMQLIAFSIQSDGSWLRANTADAQPELPCANYTNAGVCNWMVARADGQSLCRSCRYTSMIPALNRQGNLEKWASLETAKRRLFYSLIDFGLPVPGVDVDPENGLQFHFLEDLPSMHRIYTGHDGGTIT